MLSSKTQGGKSGTAQARCSFCGKTQAEVRQLVVSPTNASICDGCVEVCVDIIDEKKRLAENAPERAAHTVLESTGAAPGRPVTCTLCRMPVPVADALLPEKRGPLCPDCVAAINAAVAERDQGESSEV